MYFISFNNFLVNFDEVNLVVKEDLSILIYYKDRTRITIPFTSEETLEFAWEDLQEYLTGDSNEETTGNLH